MSNPKTENEIQNEDAIDDKDLDGVAGGGMNRGDGVHRIPGGVKPGALDNAVFPNKSVIHHDPTDVK